MTAYERRLAGGAEKIDAEAAAAALAGIKQALAEQRKSGADAVEDAIWALSVKVGGIMFAAGSILAVFGLFSFWFIRFRVALPLSEINSTMSGLSAGDTSGVIPFTAKTDEVGEMARSVQGFRVGIVTNNGPLDPAGANKATHFIQSCCQAGLPILYLQNTTGYIVGKASEEAGMIKHGSKMIQAVSNANVPQITLMCGASFGAGNYGMCGRAYRPRFLFSWPNAQTAVMGAEQAALTMAIVMEAGAKRKGLPADEEKIADLKRRIVENFERQQSALVTSALLLDDGIIDPRDTRNVLGYCLSVCKDGDARAPRPMQFGVARP
jgi:HAMP domain-containing protein